MSNKFIKQNDAVPASGPAVADDLNLKFPKEVVANHAASLKEERRLIPEGERWTPARAQEEIRARLARAEADPSEVNIAAITGEGATAIAAKYADNAAAINRLKAAVRVRMIPTTKRILAIVGPAIESEMVRIAAAHEAECKAHGIAYNRDADQHIRSLDRLLQICTARLSNESCPLSPSDVTEMLGELKAGGGIFT